MSIEPKENATRLPELLQDEPRHYLSALLGSFLCQENDKALTETLKEMKLKWIRQDVSQMLLKNGHHQPS